MERSGGNHSCKTKRMKQHQTMMKMMSTTSATRGGKMPADHILRCVLLALMLCLVPDLIAALKDVSVTIPQAVKRGSNALLTCNYDMENDTLYSVKWYKGRREFYRYTPKENPAMKVFAMTSGLNVERNLSNQSHVVLVAVPLNISGKFTCEISVEAPTFQTAMVSGEMEVVELPLEQASVTGIQPRYRIGDLVDGNCSIRFSKPAANLTWTINGIVVPPHHIKTYQIEKHEENALESVMSAVHFMVTTTHFLKGQMRLKCTASIFDIFKEEIESVIEEDRPRIMASGRSYDLNNYPYEQHASGDGLEDHNESYLTYYSAADITSSASPSAQIFLRALQKRLQRIWAAISALVRRIDDGNDSDAAAAVVAAADGGATRTASLLPHVKGGAAEQFMTCSRNDNDRWRCAAKKVVHDGRISLAGIVDGVRGMCDNCDAPTAPIAISMSALAAIAVALTRRHFKSGCQSASNVAPSPASASASPSKLLADNDNSDADDDDNADGGAGGGALVKARIYAKSHCNCVLTVASICAANAAQRRRPNGNGNGNENPNQIGVNAMRKLRDGGDGDALSAALGTGERHFVATNPKDQSLLMTRVADTVAPSHSPRPPPAAAAC